MCIKVIALLLLLLLVGCVVATSQEQAAGSAKDCPQPQTSLSGARLEHDNACIKEYGIPCTAIPHYIGPMTAELRGESRACLDGVFAHFASGKWVAARDSKVDGTGEMITTACIPITL